ADFHNEFLQFKEQELEIEMDIEHFTTTPRRQISLLKHAPHAPLCNRKFDSQIQHAIKPAKIHTKAGGAFCIDHRNAHFDVKTYFGCSHGLDQIRIIHELRQAQEEFLMLREKVILACKQALGHLSHDIHKLQKEINQ